VGMGFHSHILDGLVGIWLFVEMAISNMRVKTGANRVSVKSSFQCFTLPEHDDFNVIFIVERIYGHAKLSVVVQMDVSQIHIKVLVHSMIATTCNANGFDINCGSNHGSLANELT